MPGTVTIGAEDFSIYGTLAEADTYFLARLGADTWDAATDEEKSKGLVTATRWLDRLVWAGTKTDPDQELQWPRTGVTCNGVAVDPDEIPVSIEQATYELALVLLDDAEAQESADTGSNVKRAKADTVEVEFFTGTIGRSPVLPQVAFSLVKCLFGGSAASAGGAAYGTDECPYVAGSGGGPLA